jgi:two-component system response regulator QseB
MSEKPDFAIRGGARPNGGAWVFADAALRYPWGFPQAADSAAPGIARRRDAVLRIHGERHMRLLLVEDDAMIGESLQLGLGKSGHAVDWVQDGQLAVLALKNDVYDLMILDLGLPGKDGLALLREIRDRGNEVPVLVVTARDAVDDRVAGLNAGADDYLVKPYDLKELQARMHAVMRRRHGRTQPAIHLGGLALDPITRQVTLHGAQVSLSAREFTLLHALMTTPGAVRSRRELEEALYGWGQEVESNAVEVHIHKLRQKLGARTIENVRGAGYRVADPDEIDT